MRKAVTLVFFTITSIVIIVFSVITIKNNQNKNNSKILNNADKIQVNQDKGETNNGNKQQIINRLKSLGY